MEVTFDSCGSSGYLRMVRGLHKVSEHSGLLLVSADR